MGLNCACPITSIPDLIDVTCPIDFDQIVRLGFTKAKSAADFDATLGNEITNETAWTTKLASISDTKLQVSPPIANLVIPTSEAAYIGGNDNSTVDGMAYYVGEDNVRLTFEIHSAQQEAITAMDDLSCMSDPTLGGTQLTVFMLTRRIRSSSRVLAIAGAAANEYKGIPIYNFRMSTVGSEGYNAKNVYMGSFDMKASDLRELVTAEIAFSPFALANA